MTPFEIEFNAIQKEVHQTAIEKGWWQDQDADFLDALANTDELKTMDSVIMKLRTIATRLLNHNDGEKIALMHSELSEALEGIRHSNPPSDKIPSFLAAEEECADTIIRIMDLAEKRQWRIAEAVTAKAAYNKGRTHKHGGKKF